MSPPTPAALQGPLPTAGPPPLKRSGTRSHPRQAGGASPGVGGGEPLHPPGGRRSHRRGCAAPPPSSPPPSFLPHPPGAFLPPLLSTPALPFVGGFARRGEFSLGPLQHPSPPHTHTHRDTETEAPRRPFIGGRRRLLRAPPHRRAPALPAAAGRRPPPAAEAAGPRQPVSKRRSTLQAAPSRAAPGGWEAGESAAEGGRKGRKEGRKEKAVGAGKRRAAPAPAAAPRLRLSRRGGAVRRPRSCPPLPPTRGQRLSPGSRKVCSPGRPDFVGV